MDNYLPSLLFLELQDSNEQKIYEIELDKDKKATISFNAVISFSNIMLQEYLDTPYSDTAYLFLTVETPEDQHNNSYYVSQQYIEVPLEELRNKNTSLVQLHFTTTVQSEFIVQDGIQSFNKLNFKLSVAKQRPGHAGTTLSIKKGTFFSSLIPLKG